MFKKLVVEPALGGVRLGYLPFSVFNKIVYPNYFAITTNKWSECKNDYYIYVIVQSTKWVYVSRFLVKMFNF